VSSRSPVFLWLSLSAAGSSWLSNLSHIQKF
jgi:hypothetical protein